MKRSRWQEIVTFLFLFLEYYCQNVVEATKLPTSDDYRVQGLELIEPAYGSFDGSMYAGLIPTEPLNKEQATSTKTTTATTYKGKLMFWYFEPTAPVYDDTIVVWLNGGPGCSSLGGCLFEHCPVTIPLYPAGYKTKTSDPLGLQTNPYSWTNATRMIYVEQPAGTGFSSGPSPMNEQDVSRDFYNFLQNFYTIFDSPSHSQITEGKNVRSKRLFFFGESYAGMYVPSIAHYIYKQNKEGIEPIINLKGIGLGNGWMDATVQGPTVIDYAYWHGMIDIHTFKALHNEWKNCQAGKAVEMGKQQYNGFHEFTIPDECGIMGAVVQAAGAGQLSWGGPNAYDVTTWDNYAMLDDPNGTISMFYNNPDVQKALHVEPSTWRCCIEGAGRRRRRLSDARNMQTKRHNDRRSLGTEDNTAQQEELLLPGQVLLAHDKPVTVVPYVASLLDNSGIRVIVYNGDRDMTTNAQGSEMLLDKMEWSGAPGWQNVSEYERGLWIPRFSTETVGGYMKQYKNLSFLVVINSGHLVPYNRPKLSLELITRFLGEESFIDKPLPKYSIDKVKNEQLDASSKSNGSNKKSINVNYTKVSRFGSNVYPILKDVIIASIGFMIGFYASRKVAELKYRQQYTSITV